MKYYVYTHSLDGKVFYVGQSNTSTEINRAYQFHKTKRNSAWNDYTKDRQNEIIVEIVKYFDDKKESELYEKELTLFYWSIGQAQCNIQAGKSKYGKVNGMYGKGYLISGENSYWKGKHLSEETKQKISKANKGRFAGENSPMYGKTHSIETREKISKTLKDSGKLKGENNPMYGKGHLISRGKHPQAKKCRVIFNDTEFVFDCFNDLTDFCKSEFKISKSFARKVIDSKKPLNTRHSKFKHLNGLIIEYI